MTFFTAVLVAGWWYLYFQIQSASDSLARASADKLLQEKRQIRATALSHVVDEMSKIIPELDARFLTEDQTISFIEQIEKLAGHSGIELSPTSISKNPTAGTLDLSVKVSGNYTNLMNYLELIENMPYNIITQKIKIKQSQSRESLKGKEPEWIGELSFSLLSFIPKNEEN